MTVILFILILFIGVRAENGNKTICDGFQTNFDVKSVMGTWYVVAIIPDKFFPDNRENVLCYKVEFSEIDEAGLRWMINNTLKTNQSDSELIGGIKGTIVRQRYFSEKPFDVWSKNIGGVKGCFQQVLALNSDKSEKSEINKALSHDATMQLHILETTDKTGPYLLQILWGRRVSAVIYRRKEGVIQEQLKPAFEFMRTLRGPQRIPRICEKSVMDIISP